MTDNRLRALFLILLSYFWSTQHMPKSSCGVFAYYVGEKNSSPTAHEIPVFTLIREGDNYDVIYYDVTKTVAHQKPKPKYC